MFYRHLVFKSYRKIVQNYLLSKISILVVSLQKIKNQKAQNFNYFPIKKPVFQISSVFIIVF